MPVQASCGSTRGCAAVIAFDQGDKSIQYDSSAQWMAEDLSVLRRTFPLSVVPLAAISCHRCSPPSWKLQ